MQQPASEPTLPRSLAVLGGALNAIVPPTGPFDPQGEWEHGYGVNTVVPSANGQRVAVARQGSLILQREPATETTFELRVRLVTSHGARTRHSVDARLLCATDRLATPREWELTSRVIGPQGEARTETEFHETGGVSDGLIRWHRATERTMPVPERLTSNWSLLDALQRLGADDTQSLTFGMLEGLDLLKHDQHLVRRDATEVELAGGAVRLEGFEQTGRGILPYAYWRDDQCRLLLAVGGMRAYLWDATILNEAQS